MNAELQMFDCASYHILKILSDVGHWDKKTKQQPFYQMSACHESLDMKKFEPVAWVSLQTYLHSLNPSQ